MQLSYRGHTVRSLPQERGFCDWRCSCGASVAHTPVLDTAEATLARARPRIEEHFDTLRPTGEQEAAERVRESGED